MLWHAGMALRELWEGDSVFGKMEFFGGACHNFRVSGSYFQTVFPFKMRNFVKINFDAFLSKDSFKLDRSSIEIGV